MGVVLVEVLFGGEYKFYAWNPTTGYLRKFNKRPPIESTPFVDEYILKFYGLGYAPNIGQYIYIQIYKNKYDGIGIVEGYSLTNDEWFTIDTSMEFSYTDTDDTIGNGSLGLYFAEHLHWLVLSSTINSYQILAYKFSDGQFEVVGLPRDVDLSRVELCSLVILDECLTFSGIFDDAELPFYVVKIWAMKQYGGQRCWSHNVTLHMCDWAFGYILLVCFTDYGIVYINNSSEMILRWNNIYRVVEHQMIEIIQIYHRMAIYEESLLWV
ncbi:uncharacterized protein LOC109806301 [Cajanus cajan]|nr:uncharacterized protein LOC109806301 [Cajanus cajan]